ncbi:MAG: HDIG domain-containing protein, partial [Patescibacteria group bacterium]|nr:HDIG domain-containing protein [Patescibacteria group bacterium]
MKIHKIPEAVLVVVNKIKENGFKAHIVGGCVRDLLMNREPKDWDITTNAKPEELLKIIPDGKYENQFGTVMVPLKYIEGVKEENWEGPNIEITTYRIESTYSDKRHPDEVQFAKTLEEDLSRRDFTVNAMAIELDKKGVQEKIVDLFEGEKDLKNKVIRAVGDADERFNEDALRMMRAIRFAVQLGFEIENKTFKSIEKNAKNLRYISQERIRDEFDKIILSGNPSKGVELLIESGLMDQFIPEIVETIGVKQNRHHYYGPYNTVYAHMLASLEKCPSEKLEVRLASFFHDIGKPKSKRGEGEMSTFHGHEYGGARIVEKVMRRMKYPRKILEKTVLLVKNHMFYYN